MKAVELVQIPDSGGEVLHNADQSLSPRPPIDSSAKSFLIDMSAGEGITFSDAPDFCFSASKLENQKGLVSSVCDFLCDFDGVSGDLLKIRKNACRASISGLLRAIDVTSKNPKKPPENKS